MRKWIVSAATLVALAVLGGTAFAQNAQVTGTLTDESGGVLPGVSVTARNQETGLTRTAVTEGTGEFRLPAGVSRMLGRDFGVTADVIVVRRKADRDTIDVNLPTRLRACGRFRSSAV